MKLLLFIKVSLKSCDAIHFDARAQNLDNFKLLTPMSEI